MSRVIKSHRSLILVFFSLAALFASTAPMPRLARSANAAPGLSRTTAEARETFVFQVGIDKYTNVRQLDGCVQDVLDLKKLLIKKFNVPADHFWTLTDGQATHDAIIAGFRKQLIENAKAHRDAIVIFQFSGHGSRVKDRTGNKADGLSSTLVPVNSRDLKGSYFDIVDDEIRALFEELSQHTSNITFIIDACHSGNPTRGGDNTRGIPEDERPQPDLKLKVAATRGGLQVRGGDIAGILPRDQRYVSIAATRSYELAHEVDSADRHNGALTFYLLRALEKAKPETTYRQMMSEVANAVTAKNADQHPQGEGDIGRPVFGGSANREDPFIEIQEVKGDMLTIKAGAAQGIAPETIVAVYASDALRLSGSEKLLATGRVTKVDAFTSIVKLIPKQAEANGLRPDQKLDATAAISLQAKVVVISPDFGSTRTRVAIAKAASTRGASATAELADLLKTSTSLSLAGEVDLDSPNPRGINWDVVVKRVKFGDWFQDSQGAGTKPRPADRQVYCITGADGTRPLFGFFVELDDSSAAQKIVDALEHLANQRKLLTINNETSQLSGAVKINVFRVFGHFIDDKFHEDKRDLVKPPMDSQDYPFDQEEIFRLEIENQSNQDLYVTVFEIGSDGGIAILYPAQGGGIEMIPKGGKISPDVLLRKTTGPPGIDIFKLIASTERKGHEDFAPLEQSGVRTARSREMSIASQSDWTTAQINFWISNKVK